VSSLSKPPKPGADRPGPKKKALEAAPMTPEEIEEAIGEVETRLDRLRALYEMYFTGIERLEPAIQKKDVERRLYQLRKEQIRNTGLRFRFNMLVQRFNTMQTYWMRVSRAIEEGRHRRDVMKRRQAIQEAREKRRGRDDVYEVGDEDVEIIEDDAPAAAPAAAPVAPAGLMPVDRPAASAASAGGLVFRRPVRSEMSMQAVRPPPAVDVDALSEGRMREIYRRYLEVRKECRESVDNVPYDKMAKALRGMEPELRKKAGGRRVDFEVTIKDGKAFLKPVAR